MTTRLGPNFAKLWTASTISNLGDGIVLVAFPLIVASLTRDPLAVAIFSFATRLPWVVVALPAGALADRFDRRRLMVYADLFRGAVLVLLALMLDADGDIPLAVLYVAGFLLGTAETFFDSASEGFLPALVGEDQLTVANGRLVSARWVANSFAGPPLGAVLFTLAAAAPLYVDGLTFAVAALLVVTIGGSFRPPRAEPVGRLRDDISRGWRWLWDHRLLRTLTLMAGVYNMVVFAIVSIFVLYVQDEVGLGDVGFGIAMAALGVGGLVGGLGAKNTADIIGETGTLLAAVVSASAAALIIGLLPHPVTVALGIFAFGIATTLWNVVAVSLRQELTPDELRGRVSAAARMISWGAQPIGALLGGAVAAIAGLRAPFILTGVVLAAMVVVARPLVTERELAGYRS